MKKWILWILTLAVLCSFAVFALGSGSDEETSDQGSGKTETQQEDENSLGKYSVEIKSCRMAKDYEGKPVVIVTYKYTNVSDENPAAFYIAFEDAAYQNGVGLNKAYILDDGVQYNDDNQTKEIKKGASLDVEVAYELNDTTTDIEVEVKELFSFNNKVLKKTFSLAG